MTNLTEQWKNGELINEEDAGCYYIETIDGEIYPDCLSPIDGFKNTYNYAVKKILAPVPSYAEYMILVSYKEELTKACKMRDKIIKKYQDIDTWWKAENQKLKELLKICKCEFEEITTFCNNEIEYAYKHTNNFCIPTESLAIILGFTDDKELLTKIDEVLE